MKNNPKTLNELTLKDIDNMSEEELGQVQVELSPNMGARARVLIAQRKNKFERLAHDILLHTMPCSEREVNETLEKIRDMIDFSLKASEPGKTKL